MMARCEARHCLFFAFSYFRADLHGHPDADRRSRLKTTRVRRMQSVRCERLCSESQAMRLTGLRPSLPADSAADLEIAAVVDGAAANGDAGRRRRLQPIPPSA